MEQAICFSSLLSPPPPSPPSHNNPMLLHARPSPPPLHHAPTPPQLHAHPPKTGDRHACPPTSETLSGALHDGSWNDARFLVSLLRLCAKLQRDDDGGGGAKLCLQLHSAAVKAGLAHNAHLRCALLDLHARLGRLGSCKKLLADAEAKDSVLWNKHVAMLAEWEEWADALDVFREMQRRGVRADGYTCARALHACGQLAALREGRSVHAHAAKAGLLSHPLVGGFLVGMYASNAAVETALTVLETTGVQSVAAWNSAISCCTRLGLVNDAMELVDRMARSGLAPNLVTWNAVMSGCSRHGRDRGAIGVLHRILEQGLRPDAATVTSLLKAVANLGLLGHGREIHGYVLGHELAPDVYTGTSLVDMYAKCGRLDSARRVFDTTERKNVSTWNALVSGYAAAGQFDAALELVEGMKRARLEPDIATWNGLITGYAANGLSAQVMLLLRQMEAAGVRPNVVTWTSLISGSCQGGEYEDSFYFFHEMQNEGVQPSTVTVSVLLRACAALALLTKGKELHCFALRRGYDVDIVVATALIDMYSKAGSLATAKTIFERTPRKKKSLVCCNAMMTGLAAHGQAREAIALFYDMWDSGVKPDSITFTALLSACRSTGMITEGWEYFDGMETRYGVTPTIENYACMVDLLARCGYLDEAMDFIERSPVEPEASFWGALLAGCSIHRNLGLAEAAARRLFRLEPYNSANYLLMVNLYEHEQMWDEAESLKYAMRARGVNTRAGWSWIQVEQSIHVFEVEGKSHPDTAEIYEELVRLVFQIRKAGYAPDTSCIAYNVPEEEKERLLLSHTEKLAITYGLLRSGRSAPVRVIKNTRMCNDCHEVAKHVSALCDREIILRDAARFHHFVCGKCSCDDYW